MTPLLSAAWALVAKSHFNEEKSRIRVRCCHKIGLILVQDKKKNYCLAVKLRISALCLPPAAQPTNDELLLIFGGYKLQEAGVPA
jgi:hypothetical protein